MENQVHIPIDGALRARLDAARAWHNADEQSIIRRALEDFLAWDETHGDNQTEDEARWKAYADSGIAIPHEQVKQWLDEEIAALSVQLGVRK